MKAFAIVFLMVATVGCFAQTGTTETSSAIKKSSFTVKGDCEHCQTRIEEAALSVKGVKTATWSSEFQMVTITFDETKTQLDKIHKAIASVGHDTEKEKANDKVYNALPGCCKYRDR